ncbi:unnamed protein product [Adineta ricciae]|uniref:Uncharacterized protein n=1 Tax=Adineta ricciae TaxID=249248 RepID=A0A816FK94_ADIRI|nr:unnamed protein product [Adineta ricciae]CAF1662647.1 unnamed protein product [Adineta ricciae]
MFILTILIIANFAEQKDEREVEGLVNSAVGDQLEPQLAERMEDESDEYSSFTQYRVKRARGGAKNRGGSSEHEKHEKGQTRKSNDKKGGEKGDARRPYRK